MQRDARSPAEGTERSPEGSRRTLDALRALVEATTGTGHAFFDALVVNLARSLGARHALVGELTNDATARTLAVAWDGVLGDNFVYELAGTPCGEVLGAGQIAYHPRDAARLFPGDTALARLGVEAYLGAPLRAPDGTTLGLLVVLHDRPLDDALEPISVLRIFAARAASELDRLRSEARRRESEDVLRFALDAASMATFDWDLERRRLSWSARFPDVLGVSPGALGDGIDAFLALVHPDDRDAVVAAGRDALAGRRAPIDLQFRVGAPGVGERWIHQRGRVLRSRGAPRISGVVADVTARRKLEEGLLHAQKMEGLGRLAGGVAHDFNNLLTVIRSFTELAAEHVAGDPEALELVRPIAEAADRAANLTRQLLAFARRQVMEPRILDLDRSVRNLARFLARLLGEHIRLDVRCEAGGATVRIDPGQLEQVLVNLAVNGRDAMGSGGVLTVHTDLIEVDAEEARRRALPREGPHVRVRVQDTGAGMDAETLERAFEPFFTTKAADRGTGLGLATCHGIVAQAGGAVWLESAPGRGTTAVVLLPRHAGVEVEERLRTPVPAVRGDATLLFVEDEDPVRAVAARTLGALGYRVMAARDGVEALSLAMARGGPIDLLVTDMVLPHMDGREVARRVRALVPGIRVLYTSGFAELLPDGTLEPGAAFLQKPYTPAELAERIRGVMGR